MGEQISATPYTNITCSFLPIVPRLIDHFTSFIEARFAKAGSHLEDPSVFNIFECITLHTPTSSTPLMAHFRQRVLTTVVVVQESKPEGVFCWTKIIRAAPLKMFGQTSTGSFLIEGIFSLGKICRVFVAAPARLTILCRTNILLATRYILHHVDKPPHCIL